MSNPFLTTSSQEQPINFMDKVMKRLQGSSTQRNVFKVISFEPKKDVENDHEAANVPTSEPTPTAEPIFQRRSQHKSQPKPEPPVVVASGFPTASDKATLSVKIGGQSCIISKTVNKQIKAHTELTPENMKIVITEPMKASIGRVINCSDEILNGLTSLYEMIRDSNEVILSAVRNVDGDSMPKILLHNRLRQGLYYYHPVSNQALQVLQFALHNHTFSKLINLVGQKYGLDVLKAFYVVRSVHQQRGIIKKGLPSFFIEGDIHPLPEAQVLRLSQGFLEQDKCNLLQVYAEILNCRRNSMMRIFKFREEVDILWGNMTNITKQSLKIQQIAAEIFVKYWNLSEDELKTSQGELYLISRKLLSLNVKESLKIKINAIGINIALRERRENFKQSDFAGPFLQLFKFFLQQDTTGFDFKRAFENLRKIEIEKQWIVHIQSTIKRIIFLKDSQLNIPRCAYIFQVLMKLKEQNIQLPLKVQEQFIIKVLKSCSLIVGMMMLDSLFTDVTAPALLPYLTRLSEKDLKITFHKEAASIFEWTSQSTIEHLMETNLALIQRITLNAITSGDIQSLQRQVSSGKAYWIDLEGEGQNYHFIRCYCQHFLRFPSLQHQIQQNINYILQQMKAKSINISRSIQTYHAKLLSSSRQAIVFTGHLAFLYEIVNDIGKLCEYSKSWLQKIKSLNLNSQLNNLEEILCIVSDKLISTDQKELFTICLDFINAFYEEITNISCTAPLSLEGIQIFYSLHRIAEWSEINDIKDLTLVTLFNTMRTLICEQNCNMNDLVKKVPVINSAIKLFLICQMISNDQQHQNALNRYLSLNGSLRFQLYSTLSENLKRQKGAILLETFSIAAEYDEDLLYLLLQKNIESLVSFMKSSSINVTINYHQIKLGFLIAASSKLQDLENSENINNLLNLIIVSAIKACKTKEMPWKLHSKLLCICAQAMNRVEYPIHMECMKLGLKRASTLEISSQMDDHFCQLIVYLICLFISRLRNTDMSSSSSERGGIMTEIEMFRILAELTLASFSTFHQINVLFVGKYLQIIEFFMKNALIVQFAAQSFRKIEALLRDRINSAEEMSPLWSLFQRIQRLRQTSTGVCESLEGQEGIGSYEYAYNKELKRMITTFSKIKQNDKRRNHIKSMIYLIEEKKEAKITFDYPSNLQNLLIDERSILHVRFVSDLVSNISWQKCTQQAANHIKNYLSQFQIKWFPSSEYSWITAIRQYITIFNELIDSSTFSPFVLFTSKIKENIMASLREVSNMIHSWTHPANCQPFATLENIELELDNFPTCWKGIKLTREGGIFSLWNLVLYREKLNLIAVILRFYRLMNGLLPRQCLLIDEFTPFLVFFAENMNKLSSEAVLEKIKAANILLQRSGRAQAVEENSHLMQPFALEKMKLCCVEISQDLQFIDSEIDPKTDEILEKMCYRSDL